MTMHSAQEGLDRYRMGEPIESALERLRIQECQLIQQMDGVFPERQNDLHGFSRILDFACGAGTWAIQIAQMCPECEVIGIEQYGQLVSNAGQQARELGVFNVTFQLVEERASRLPYPDNHFDLVNTHFLFTLLQSDEWPSFVQECLRLVRPGGYLRLIEPEWEETTSPAFEQFKSSFLHCLKGRGQSLAANEKHIGTAFLLKPLLNWAGAIEIGQRLTPFPYWIEPYALDNPGQWISRLGRAVGPLLLDQQSIDQSRFEDLMCRLRHEIAMGGFTEVSYILSACGRKPELMHKQF